MEFLTKKLKVHEAVAVAKPQVKTKATGPRKLPRKERKFRPGLLTLKRHAQCVWTPWKNRRTFPTADLGAVDKLTQTV